MTAFAVCVLELAVLAPHVIPPENSIVPTPLGVRELPGPVTFLDQTNAESMDRYTGVALENQVGVSRRV